MQKGPRMTRGKRVQPRATNRASECTQGHSVRPTRWKRSLDGLAPGFKFEGKLVVVVVVGRC